MIKFFRKIRQRLLAENRFNKYLLYALGEIALVMIGILLALQVNNWNETRKEKNFETKILKEIKYSMEQDLERTELIYKYRAQRKQKAISEVIEMINTKETVSDSLFNKKMQDAALTLSFYYDKGPFESLKSRGLDVIRNDSLRTEIIRFYEVGLPLGIIFLSNRDGDVYQKRKAEFRKALVDKEFEKQDTVWRVNFHVDFQKVKRSKEIRPWLGLEQGVSDNYIRRLESLIRQYKLRIALVDKELNKKGND